MVLLEARSGHSNKPLPAGYRRHPTVYVGTLHTPFADSTKLDHSHLDRRQAFEVELQAADT